MTRGVRTSSEVKARALARMDAGEVDEEIANAEGLPRRTVSQWRSGWREMRVAEQADEEVQRLRQVEKATFRAGWSKVVQEGLPRLAEAVASGKASPNMLAYALGVSFDKVRLIDNEPTAITADTDLASFLKGAGYEAERRKLRVVKGGKQEAEAS